MKPIPTFLLSVIAVVGLHAANPSFRDLVFTNSVVTISNRLGSNFVFRSTSTNTTPFAFSTTVLQIDPTMRLATFDNKGTNQLTVTPWGGLVNGQAPALFGDPTADNAFLFFSQLDLDGLGSKSFEIHAVQDAMFTSEAYVQASCRATTPADYQANLTVSGPVDTWSITVRSNVPSQISFNGGVMKMAPGAFDNTTPYRLNSTLFHTVGNSFELANFNTNMFTVSSKGNATISGYTTSTNGTYYPSNAFTVASISAGMTNGAFWVGTLSNALQSVWMSNNVTLFKILAP